MIFIVIKVKMASLNFLFILGITQHETIFTLSLVNEPVGQLVIVLEQRLVVFEEIFDLFQLGKKIG